MILETNRLLLRPWRLDDAFNLYEYARDERVGPIAGWPVHSSVINSAEIIESVLSAPNIYAVCLKSDNKAIGSVGIMMGDQNREMSDDEGEIGYWLGVPFWGQGLIPEAVQELIRHGFEDLGLNRIWCGHFDGNNNSKKVQEKCGFKYKYTMTDKDWPTMETTRVVHYSCIEKEEWLQMIK